MGFNAHLWNQIKAMKYILTLIRGRKMIECHLSLLVKYWFSSSKDALCQVWLKMAQWFWRRFLNLIKVFPLLCYHLLLEKDIDFHLNKLESPSSKNVLCQVWLKLFMKKISTFDFHYFVIIFLGKDSSPLFE